MRQRTSRRAKAKQSALRDHSYSHPTLIIIGFIELNFSGQAPGKLAGGYGASRRLTMGATWNRAAETSGEPVIAGGTPGLVAGHTIKTIFCKIGGARLSPPCVIFSLFVVTSRVPTSTLISAETIRPASYQVNVRPPGAAAICKNLDFTEPALG